MNGLKDDALELESTRLLPYSVRKLDFGLNFSEVLNYNFLFLNKILVLDSVMPNHPDSFLSDRNEISLLSCLQAYM